MNYRIECKEDAKNLLSGRWSNAAGATIVYAFFNIVFSFLLSIIPLVGWILLYFLTAFLTGSFIKYCMKLTESGERVKYLDCFISFKATFKITVFNILTSILSILVLVIIFPIILALSLQNSVFILLIAFLIILAFLALLIEAILFPIPMIFTEDENVGILEALDISIKITKGHRIAYIVMKLSFIGWIILSWLILGIGMLWLQPYMTLSYYLFYKAIRSNNNFI